MDTLPPDPRASALLENVSPVAQWALLLAGSILLAALLELAGLPAALLLGPMIAGIVGIPAQMHQADSR